MSGASLAINPSMCARLELSCRESLYLAAMMNAHHWMPSIYKHHLLKYDHSSVVCNWGGLIVGDEQHAEHLLLSLARKGIFYISIDDDGIWFGRGPASAGWNRSEQSDMDDYNAWLSLRTESLKNIQQPRNRPSGGAWDAVRLKVFQRDKFTCTYCGAQGVDLFCDHIVPFSSGGSDDKSNLTTACQTCNSSKGSKSLEEWLSGSAT